MRFAVAITLSLLGVPALSAQRPGENVPDGTIRLAADTAASSIEFSVRFLGLGRVWGEFHGFSGTVSFDPADLSRSIVNFSVDVSTIDTDNGHRDQDLSENWFEMGRFPTATFASDSLVAHGERWLAYGRLQIKDVTRDLTVPLTISVSTGADGATAAQVRGSFTIDRMIYGIDDEPTSNPFFDASTMVVGDDVTIDLRLRLVDR